MTDLKDSGEHAIEHALLKESVSSQGELLKEIRIGVQSMSEIVSGMRLDLAEMRSNLAHAATREDVSTAISTCRATHKSLAPRAMPIDWKGLGVLVTAIVGAVAALVLAILKVFV